MLRTFIQVTAVALTLVASFFLLRGNLVLSVKNIAEISETMWGYSKPVVTSLSRQQADTKVGFCFLLLAFALQVGNLLWPMRISDFEVSRVGVITAVLFSVSLLLAGVFISRTFGHAIEKQALDVLDQRRSTEK